MFIFVCVFLESNIRQILVTFYFGEVENTVESLYFYEFFIKVASRQCCTSANSSPLNPTFIVSFSFY